jgi:predicted helicase
MTAKTRTNLTSLERLERQLLPITPSRAQGDAWEKALKGWINAGGHPELTKAWMWGEWPGKLKAGLKGDKGVDLVAETRDKQLVAIQVKFRENPNDPVTAPEVQKLVGSYRKHFTLFALASNAWSATRGVSEAVGDEDAMLILREQLLESSYDWAAKKSIKRTKFTPFPFQKVAAENVRKALAKGGRAQIVMACGTGKTVTMLLAAEALDAQRVLVLAPTLLLVKQLRDEWVSKRRPDREWASLAVCSDIGDGVDASEIAPAEFGAPPTTNPDEIAAFLKKPGRRVVFGTYASSDRIAKAQKKAGVPAFDLAVADEAHRIAGVVSAKDKSERSQRVMLEEKEIKAVRRLFATATPRITGSKKTREADDILIESMDDESRFGKVAYSVTFQEAVKLKRLVPYKLVVTIVTNDEVADAVQNRRFIDVNGKPYAADEVATAIAIRRAYKELGISKIISYHSRVAGAKSFAELITKVPGRGKSPATEHVAGSMPVNDRKQVLNRLAAATEPYLVTNARCLTEGIDVPALDAVAFADPRKSQVDIVQAVGRAMRRPMGKSKKTTGYIILPVYLLKQDLKDPEAAVEGSAFEPVLQVLRALKDHDPFMARFMAKVLVQKGKRPYEKGKGIEEIIEVSVSDALDALLSRKLAKAIELRALEVAADNFELGCAFLASYVAEFGNALIPAKSSYRNFRLGPWVSNKRADYFAGQLSTNAAKALEAAGMVWDVFEAQWQEGYFALSNFLKNHKFAEINSTTTTKAGFRIKGWVALQRSAWREGKMVPSRVAALQTLPGWDWTPRDGAWERKFESLQQYVAVHGTAHVALSETYKGVALGSWVANQRQLFKQEKLTPFQSAALEALPGWRWTPRNDSWADGHNELLRYVKKHGLADFPNNYVCPSGFKLGQWASVRR